MKIIEKSVEELTPYENNPRKNDGAVDAVAASIREFGFKVPIIIDKDNVIVAGHTRLKAARKLGLETVPCIIADDLSPKQIQAFRLADNKTAELADWDFDMLSVELSDLDDIDMSEFGFDMSEFEEPAEAAEDDYDYDSPVESRVKQNDVWVLGAHRLMCGDSTDPAVIDRLMDGVKADCVFTDPPYNLETEGGKNGPIGKSLAKQGESIAFIADFEPTEFLNVLPSIFNGNMNAYVFCNKDLLPEYLTWAKNNEYSFNVLIWKKPSAIPINAAHYPDIEYLLFFRKNAIWNPSIEDVNYSRCLEYSRVTKTKENGKHPTIKPVELIANELKISSNKDSVVVDLFGGSGSTLIACEQLNRKCYMCELDPHYCDVIINRWEQFTGRKAVLLND